METTKKYTAIVASPSGNTIAQIKEAIADLGMFKSCKGAFSMQEALDMSKDEQPDVLLSSLLFKGYDGIALIEEYRRQYPKANTKLVIYDKIAADEIANFAISKGADYVISRPATDRSFSDALVSLLTRDGIPSSRISIITSVMCRLGVSLRVKGFYMLRTAIRLTLEDESYIYNITGRLYPAVAEELGSTPCRVERNMRHAIEVAWTRGDLPYTDEVFGYSVDAERGKPTNAAFIATVADYVRMCECRIN